MPPTLHESSPTGRESGQTTAEYSVVLVVLVSASALLFTSLGGAVTNLITSMAGLLP